MTEWLYSYHFLLIYKAHVWSTCSNVFQWHSLTQQHKEKDVIFILILLNKRGGLGFVCAFYLLLGSPINYTEPVNAASRSQNRAGLPYLPAYVLVLSLSHAYASALEIYPLNPNCFLY